MRARAAGIAAVLVLFFWSAGAAASGSLAGVTLGQSVLSVTASLGPPDLVQSTDDGQEWRWFDARGIDIDLLADDALFVHQVLIARPQSQGRPAPLVQPKEWALLASARGHAERTLAAAGAKREPEPERAISAWRLGSQLLVLEFSAEAVAKILLLDDASARRFGYLGAHALSAYRAPRLVRQAAVEYPKGAIRDRAQGVVVVRVVVSSAGAVKDARIILSSGNADIDAAETQSMRQSTFRPAHCDGMLCEGVFLDREDYSLDG
ncbi:MAG: hypothetical protein DLM53_08535 [Candidatus Eremiobacter antarcticus]|nr:TonB family protein [Candidatus Eremiobacteraeota bacterium]MBC5809125.1 TonB family protein [Candidatus Eremiobacteraeota bacterium]PZR61621.1 MAG: hypothetical protein DLM53_08535 [Candidatus Eremiobacter sp. RRmetagenome_bin22]